MAVKNIWAINEKIEDDIKVNGPVSEQIRRGEKYLTVEGCSYYNDYVVCPGCNEIFDKENTKKNYCEQCQNEQNT